jgi:hypothetical protein
LKKLYNLYYNRLSIPNINTDNQLHLLNEDEIAVIRRQENLAIFWSASIGMLGVLFLYLPQYWFPELFPDTELNLPIIGKIQFPLIATLFGIPLVFVEIYALTLLNIHSVHRIAAATGFINLEDKNTDEKRSKLLGISTEEKDKSLLNYGIDPLQGMAKYQIFLITALFALKATLSNLVMKIVVRRVLGRYAVREVLDMLGIPVFAFWNALATRTVLREARVVIMGQNLIDNILKNISSNELLKNQFQNPENQTLLYDTLQFIAISKRDFHANHVYLTHHILDAFAVPIKEKHLLSKDYLQNLSKASEFVENLCKFIIILGFLLDGSFSFREIKRLQELNKVQILEEEFNEIRAYKNDFLNGKGLEKLEKKYLTY